MELTCSSFCCYLLSGVARRWKWTERVGIHRLCVTHSSCVLVVLFWRSVCSLPSCRWLSGESSVFSLIRQQLKPAAVCLLDAQNTRTRFSQAKYIYTASNIKDHILTFISKLQRNIWDVLLSVNDYLLSKDLSGSTFGFLTKDPFKTLNTETLSCCELNVLQVKDTQRSPPKRLSNNLTVPTFWRRWNKDEQKTNTWW